MAPTVVAEPAFRTTRAYMDTTVTIAVVAPAADGDCAAVAERAFAWFAEVEACCSRFDPGSELRRLADRAPGQPVPVSPMLFEAVRFACAVAARSAGAFDPAVGARQQARGFVRNYRTGRREPWQGTACATAPPCREAAASAAGDPRRPTGAAAAASPAPRPDHANPRAHLPSPDPTWRDIALDPGARTITLRRPLLLDLGAVAKGMAVDLATRELGTAYRDFMVEAGGDLFAGGCSAGGRPWRVGLRHPRAPDAFYDILQVTDAAVCTSGDYARQAEDGGHHILDPRTARAAGSAIACTVLAPSAMLADALATAAFVLGPDAGPTWLAREGVQGLVVGADLRPHATTGWRRHSLADPTDRSATRGLRDPGGGPASGPGLPQP